MRPNRPRPAPAVETRDGSHSDPQAVSRSARPGSPLVWDSRTLLGGGTQACISHQGETYRLQLTRQGKLILTK